MYIEEKKLHIIEDVLKIKSEPDLNEIRATIDRIAKFENHSKVSAHNFSGIFSEEDAALIETAIEAACEQVDPDDWK